MENWALRWIPEQRRFCGLSGMTAWFPEKPHARAAPYSAAILPTAPSSQPTHFGEPPMPGLRQLQGSSLR